jgi:hypothetical protein
MSVSVIAAENVARADGDAEKEVEVENSMVDVATEAEASTLATCAIDCEAIGDKLTILLGLCKALSVEDVEDVGENTTESVWDDATEGEVLTIGESDKEP